MLGTAVRAELQRLGLEYVTTASRVDITDQAAIADHAGQHPFSAIVNCAAYTRVDDAEADQDRAMAVNGLGPANLARAAAQIGAHLVHFSTDYVFDGRADRPYTESDACAPLNVYGRSKLAGEQAVLGLTASLDARRAYVIRTSWLYGHAGKNFVSTMLGLMQTHQKLRVVGDQLGRPTYCPDLAAAALALLSQPARAASGLYHFANTGATSWHGFASEILRQARELGFPVVTTEIEPVSSETYPRPARRPNYGILSTSRIERVLGTAPRAWQDALMDYLKALRP
jgi:dTDP-4-dehydrorhamnose reductase